MLRILPAIGLFSLLLTLAIGAPLGAQVSGPGLLLHPGDGVRLTVRDEPTLSGEFAVAEAGVVLLPEVGLVAVADREFDELAREIRSRYERILVNPEMLVEPLLRIAVLGEVRSPGLIPADPSLTLAELLASAGGFTADADPGRILLIRDGERLPVQIAVDEAGTTAGLRSGDGILVGRQSWLRENLTMLTGTAASVMVALFTSVILR